MVEPIMVVVVAVSILLSNDDCGNKESFNEEMDDGIDSGSHGRNGDGVCGRTVAAFDCGLQSAQAVPMSAHQSASAVPMSAYEVRTSVVIEHCCASNLLQRVPSRQLEPPVVIKHVVVHSHSFDVIAVHALRVCATRAVPGVVCVCNAKGEGEHVRASMKVRCAEDKCDARVDPHALLLLQTSTPLALEKGVSLAKNSVYNHVAVLQIVVGLRTT
jgi:hypothetical protein